MNDSQILSPKPSIDEALAFLGMSNMEKSMAIKALLRIVEDDPLSLFFDEHLTCVPTSIKYGNQYDEDNGVIECLLIDPKDQVELRSGQISGSSYLYHSTTDNNFYILVTELVYNGIEYYISQGDGTIADYIEIGYEKFYFDREELIKYKGEYSAYFYEKPSSKAAHSKKPSLPEQRINAFKYWLIGNSGKSIHNTEDLQSCYEAHGILTREEIWGRLQLMDNKLFSAGKDEFKKVMKTVVQLKVGTGKDRNN
jgi:hypothetical protein